MDQEDEIRRNFESLAARGRNRVCKRRSLQNEEELDWWVSSFMEDPAAAPAVAPPVAPPQVCALSDGAGAAAVPNMPVACKKERAAAVSTNSVPVPCADLKMVASALPPAPILKVAGNRILRRNASAHGPVQQRPRRARRALKFPTLVTNRVPDNPPGERAAAGRRGDVQAVALNDRGRETETAQRILGEIAFQLDRRILTYIFTDQFRLYGFRIADMSEKINEVAASDRQRVEMNARNTEIMNNLRNHGYCPVNHSTFAEFIVNSYGILKEKPQCQSVLENYNNRGYLEKLIVENTPPPLLRNMVVLFNCLWNLSVADGKPVFIW